MTTALVPVEVLNHYAEAFAKSGMFGAKTKDQALSLLLLAQAEGVHPAIAMRDFDVIQGRPAKKAQAMHRSFLDAGGKIEWHERTDTKADATFSHPQGGTVRVTWDLERAKKAGLSGREMYGKYARQMLSARCISEGCRTVYPAATSGVYTPEETRNFEPAKTAEKDMGPAVIESDDLDNALKELEQTNAAPQAGTSVTPSSSTAATPAEPIHTRTQTLTDLCEKAAIKLADVLERAAVKHADEMSEEDFRDAKSALERRISKNATRAAS